MPEYKTALVTGAQKGIGAAIAKALINEGVNVVLNYLDDDSTVSSLVREATDKGLKAEAVKANVANRSEVDNLIDVAEKFGGLDYAVSNAAIYPRTPLLDITEQGWKEVLDVNLNGCFFTLQAAARSIIAKGNGGSILTISSGAAFKGAVNGAHYSASKSGLFGLTKSAALELAPHNIRANVIAPGLVDTDQPRGEFSNEDMERIWKTLPLAGKTEPSDIADLAIFLLSGKASRITGQVLHVNGGGLMP